MRKSAGDSHRESQTALSTVLLHTAYSKGKLKKISHKKTVLYVVWQHYLPFLQFCTDSWSLQTIPLQSKHLTFTGIDQGISLSEVEVCCLFTASFHIGYLKLSGK